LILTFEIIKRTYNDDINFSHNQYEASVDEKAKMIIQSLFFCDDEEFLLFQASNL